MIPKSGLLENISAHSVMRSSILVLTCWCVFCTDQRSSFDPLRIQPTRSFASLNKASVKLLDASSLCILIPMFWEREFASLKPTTSALRHAHMMFKPTHLKCIKLHIRIPVSQALDHGRYRIFASANRISCCPCDLESRIDAPILF